MAAFELILWMLKACDGSVWTTGGDQMGHYYRGWGWKGEGYVHWHKCNLREVCKGWRHNHDQAQRVLRLRDPRGWKLSEGVVTSPLPEGVVTPPPNTPANIIRSCDQVKEVDTESQGLEGIAFGEIMFALQGCHHLKVLSFQETDLLFLVDHLPDLTSLTRLDLGTLFDLGNRCSEYTSELRESLEALPNLKSLTVEMTRDLYHVQPPCPGLKGLKYLTVNNHHGQTRNDMTHYGLLTNLVILDISNNSNIGQELCQPPSPENVGRRPCTCTVMSLTDGSELALLIFLISFKANFQQCYITDQVLQYLSGLTLLEKVELAGCVRLTDEGVWQLSKLTALQELDLYKCNKVTDESVLALASGLQALSVLNVAFVGHIEGETLEKLGTMSALTHLIFDGRWDGVDALRTRRPSLLINDDFTDAEERENYGFDWSDP